MSTLKGANKMHIHADEAKVWCPVNLTQKRMNPEKIQRILILVSS